MDNVTEKNKAYVALARKYIAATDEERQDWQDWTETEGIEDFDVNKLAELTDQLKPGVKPAKRPTGSPTGTDKGK